MKATNFFTQGLIVLGLASFILVSCHHGEDLRPQPPKKEHLENLGFTEISYGGSLFNERVKSYYYYDNYIVISNPTDKPIYLDSLALVISSFSASEYLELGEHNFLPTHISASQIMLFPGDGKQYKVDPGKSVTVAHYAVDHTKPRDSEEFMSCPNSIDLSKADFEWCTDNESLESFGERNEKAPNLITVCKDTEFVSTPEEVTTYEMKSNTSAMIALVKLGTTLEELKKDKKYRVDWQHTDIAGEHSHTFAHTTLKLPNEWVLDAVVVCPMSEYKMAIVDKSIDKGYHGVVDHGRDKKAAANKALFRKHDGKAFVDTNNSTVDFEVKQASLKK